MKGREYQLHGAASALAYTQVLDSGILDWLSGFPELWKQLIYLLAGQHEHAGILAEIVVQADKASVAQQLGGNPDRAIAGPKQSLQRQLADGLRFLVREKLKLNHPDGPADGWLTQDALWVVSKPAADQLRAYLLTQGIEGVPSSNATFFNMLQDQAIIQTNAQDKAIWKATIDNGRGWKNNFTLLKISPALIWPKSDDRPAPYAGTLTVETTPQLVEAGQPTSKTSAPASNDAMKIAGDAAAPERRSNAQAQPGPDDRVQTSECDELLALFSNITAPTESGCASQDSAAVSLPPQGLEEVGPTEQQEQFIAWNAPLKDDHTLPATSTLGEDFLAWLRTGIASHKLIINDSKALIHTVDDTAMLVTPGIFKRYVQEHPELERSVDKPEIPAWQKVQRAFERAKAHKKTKKQLNIWTFRVTGPRKTKLLKGYLLSDPRILFNDQPFNNPSLTKVVEEADA